LWVSVSRAILNVRSVNRVGFKMFISLFVLSTIAGVFTGLKIRAWAKTLPIVEEQTYYAPSMERQMYLRSIGRM